MDLPAKVLIHNELLGAKGTKGELVKISEGFYEVKLKFGERLHRVFLPISQTVIISRVPEEETATEELLIERGKADDF